MTVATGRSGFGIRLDGFSFSPAARAPRKVLDSVSLSVEPGEFVAVVGENGSGKSSLLAAIAGELECRPGEISGGVFIGDTVVDRPIHELVDGVGIVHQYEDYDLVEHLSVAQNIALRRYLATGRSKGLWLVSSASAREMRTALLSSVRGGDRFRLDQPVGRLAGGQRQLLSVIIATRFQHISNPCHLLLLDEHTSRLSSKNAEDVMAVTVEVIAACRCTTVMVTHDLAAALQYSQSIVVVRDGRVGKFLTSELDIESLKAKVFP